eukprot:XP_001698480.1 predicted protein [Chlamydomonas reinhardtii]
MAQTIPQSHPISADQVRNNAGGFVFKVDDLTLLRRYIILGSDANNYYVSRKSVDLASAQCVARLLAAGQGEAVVKELVDISREGRAPKQATGIVVLAMCARLGDPASRRAALSAVPAVCRTASTLFEWVQRCKELGAAAELRKTESGALTWGRAMRRTVARWYLDKTAGAVAYQATKYSQRNGWSHADLLRLVHPDPEQHATKRRKAPARIVLSPVMQYLVDAHRLRKEVRAPPPLKSAAGKRGRDAAESDEEHEDEADPEVIAEHEAATAEAVETALTLIRRHRFGHEHVGDTVLLRNPAVWGAFLENGMPLTAMIRNLGRMSELGVLEQPGYQQRVTDRLRDAKALTAARVHPMTLLDAMCTYRNGAGARGKARWAPVAAVTAALEDAFYLAFKNVVPTGKRYLLGLDVSGSMGCANCSGMTAVTAREAAAAVAMTLVRTEPWVKAVAFSHQLVPMKLLESDRLEEVVERSARIPMGGTDCALPMVHALQKKMAVDVFVVLTDNETWFGGVHPTEALKRYRAAMKMPDAKLVVLAFSANEFSIADPKDPGMLDVAGLDSAVPQVVADFVRGGM